MNDRVCFVIPLYFPEKKTFLHVLAALAQYPVVVVDNHSLHECHVVDALQKSKFVTLIKLPHNGGYAQAVNKGIIYALNTLADWVVVLNQDFVTDKQSIAEFVVALAKKSPGIVGPITGSLDTKRWTTILSPVTQSYAYISGSFIAIHRDVISCVGRFSEDYFMYYEDVDYSIRAAKQGITMSYLPLSSYSHTESASLQTKPYVHQYYLARNHLLFIKRHATFRVKLYEFFRFPKTVWEHVYKKEYGAIEGIGDFVLGRFGPYKGKYL